MKTNIKSMKSVVVIAMAALAGIGAHGANALKLDTTSLVTNSVNWSAGSGTGGTVAPTDIGEFGSTPSATSLAGLTLQGTNITLGGLQFDNTMAGPATIASGATMTLGSSGINMSAANQNVYANCALAISASQTWNVNTGMTLTNGSLSGYSAMVLTKSGGGSLIINAISATSGSGGEGFLVTGGSCTTPSVSIGRNGYSNPGTTGVPGGTLSTGNGFYVTNATVSLGALYIGTQNSGATARVDSNSTVTVTGQTVVGKTTSGSRFSTLQVNGGTFTSSEPVVGLQIAPNNGTVVGLGDVYLTAGSATFQKIGFGAVSDTLAGTGYLTLAGGTLYVGSGGIVKSNNIAGYNAYVCLNSGILGASANWSSSLPMSLNGSVTIQTADSSSVPHNITLSGNITNISGTGALTVTGGGMLTLGGTNTYTGATTLNAGELVGVTGGSISNTASFLVGAGATLGVQLISAGGQWTTTNVIATNASYLDINLNGFAPSTTVAPLLVLGNLATTNTLNFIVRGSALALNTAYPLVNYTGTQSGTLPANPLLLPGRVRGYVSNDSTTKAIYVVVTNTASGEPLLWTKGTGTWDTTDTNWVDVFANPATYYDPNFDQVVFDDTATGAGPFTVTLTNTFTPVGVTVNNTNKNYTISGTGGVIAGSGSLTKIGTGTLTLSTPNTFSGGLVISNGTVTLGNGSGASSGSITLGNGSTFSANGNTPGNAINVLSGAAATINNNNISPGFGSIITSADNTAVLTINLTSLSGNADQLDNFYGTVNIGASNVRYSSTGGGSNGGTNATFNLIGAMYTRNPLTQKLGALTGTGTLQGAGGSAPGNSTIYIGYKNINSTFGGVISEGSASSHTSINKLGTGVLALTNTSTYTGNTIVTGGTLEVDGQITASPVTNYAGTTLAGTGSITDLVGLGAGSTIAPGVAGVGNYGTLTCNGGLIFSGATNLVDISTTNSDLLAVSGGLYLAGGGTVVLNISGTLTNGTYPLISYDTIASGGVANLAVIPGTLGRQSFSLVTNNSQVQLQVTSLGSQTLVWASVAEGAANGTWDLTDANWTNATAMSLYTYANGDSVTFNNFGAANSPVSIPNPVQPSSVVVSGNQPYEFTGAGKISGAAGLTMNGSSTLILDTYNDYSGGTLISSGTVQVSDGTTMGTAIGSGSVTNNAALVFDQPDTTSMSSIAGTGSLTLVGGGEVIVSGNATYTGATLVNSNSTLEFGSGGSTAIPPKPFTVTNNATIGFNLSGTLLLTNGITGPGALSLDGPAVATIAGTNNTYLENTWVNNGTLKLGTNNAIPSAATIPGSTGWLVLNAGSLTAGTVDLNGFNQTVNELAGTASTVLGQVVNNGGTGTNILTVNALYGSATYAGLILDTNVGGSSGKVALVVEGPNTLTLAGANTYSGGTTVYGNLAISQAASLGSGTNYLIGGDLACVPANGYLDLNTKSLIVPGGTNGLLDLTTNERMPVLYGSGALGVNVRATTDSNHSVNYGDVPSVCANFYGTMNCTGVVAGALMSVWINGGVSDGQFQNATVNLDSLEMTGILGSGGATVQFGALNVHANASIGGEWYPGYQASIMNCQIGALGGVSDIEGPVTGFSGITKVGAGELILNNTDTYTGNTTITAGTLIVGASGDITASSVTVGTNGTLTGIGTVAGSVSVNGTIAPGTTNATGTLTCSGSVTNYATATNVFKLDVNGGTNDKLAVGNIVYGGTLQVAFLNTSPAVNSTYTLFNNFSSYSGNFTSIVGVGTAAGYGFSFFPATGVLTVSSVASGPAYQPIAASFNGTTLSLNWTNTGWTLQAQTNSLSSGLSSQWFDVSGSSSISSLNITPDPHQPTVFYRLIK